MKQPVFFWSENDRETIVEACRQHWADEVGEVLKRADLACDNTFIFTHRWDMERCEQPVSFPEAIDWTFRLNGDFEWTVMLNRARYMADLGQAYWLTGDEKYASSYIRLLKNWLIQNPLTEEEVHFSKERSYNVKDTWRKLDSGIRMGNWLKGYYCIRSSPLWGEEEESLFQQGVQLHGMYLQLAFTPHDLQSNWGFLESNGLFQIGLLFPWIDDADRWLHTAVGRLVKMAELQVFEDGMHNEQCSMYHHEVLHCLFEPIRLAEINGLEIPAVLKETLNRMFTASLALIQPDGHQPALSDSDATPMRDVLSRGAVLFRRGDLKQQGYPVLDYEGIWYFGRDGAKRYERLESREPDFCSVELQQAGVAVMRSDWSPEARYLLFDGGHMDLIQAHGHDDFLHIGLSARGREFLVDPGRYTYMENEDRKYFKESFQHNLLTVDDLPISVYESSWEWSQVAVPVNRFWRTHPDFDYVQAGHDGYWRLDQPVQVLRQILFVKPDYWILVDTCRSKGVHQYKQHFHFTEGTPLHVNPETGMVETRYGDGPNLKLIPLSKMEVRIEPCWISRHYNQKSPSSKVTFTQEGTGLTKFVTLLVPFTDEQEAEVKLETLTVLDTYGNPVSPDRVSAWRVGRAAGSEVVLFSHQGPYSYRFAQYHMSGEILLIREEGGKTTRAHVVKV